MKKLLSGILMIVTAVTLSAAPDYDRTAIKADRFFEAGEWASAQALYGILLDKRPEADSIYVKAIVASSMMGDSVAASHLLTNAMNAGIGFERLMAGVREVSFEVGSAKTYEDFLLRSQRDCRWLTRAIDAELLRYYIFRDNGPKIVKYSQIMLAGMPESVEYQLSLASGYVLAGDYDKAVGTWRRIIEQSPDSYDALIAIGNYMDLSGNTISAAEYLSRAQELRPTPFVASRLAALDRQAKNR